MYSLFSHRANADTLSEAIVCFNMVIKLLHCFFSQHSAVMSFIHIQDHCKIKFDSVMGLNWNVKGKRYFFTEMLHFSHNKR